MERRQQVPHVLLQRSGKCQASASVAHKYFQLNCYVQPCVGACHRGNVRGVLGIEGNYAEDLLCRWCCPTATCQELNEIKARTGGDEQNKFGIRKGVTYDVDAIKARMGQQGAGAPQQGYPPQY